MNKYKFFTALSMLYITIALADISLVYRLVSFETFAVTAGVFIMPLYYLVEDIISEIYGYKYFKTIIWIALGCGFVFSSIITLAIHAPTPGFWRHNDSYNIVFSHLFRVMIGGGCVAVTCGAFVNSYLVARWRILCSGKYFWIRSVGSSAIGQALQVIIGSFILYTGVQSFSEITKMIVPIYLMQISLTALLAVPGSFLVAVLKVAEGGGCVENSVAFNPFKLADEGSK
jgi:queuosine precursor transporter